MRAPAQRATHDAPAPLKIGILCFASYGGSGVLATELALGLAQRGHQIHLLSSQPPVRLQPHERLHFHQLEASTYPLFAQPPYTIAQASRLAQISLDVGLDCIHTHYAIPHAVSAYLAGQIIQRHLRRDLSASGPRLIATLHGTDVTHVGCRPEYGPTLALALDACDAITTPSAFLKAESYASGLVEDHQPIDVIPNFIDTDRFCPGDGPGQTPTLLHISNFRPVKRVLDVVETYAKVRAARPQVRLTMIGEGPDRPAAEARAAALGVADGVDFLDNEVDTITHLQRSCALLLPSESESFGLVALEALGCELPVIASRVGGLPEVIDHGQTGYLADMGDTDAMATHAITLVDDPAHARAMGQRGRHQAVARWRRDIALDQYEALYQRLLATPLLR